MGLGQATLDGNQLIVGNVDNYPGVGTSDAIQIARYLDGMYSSLPVCPATPCTTDANCGTAEVCNSSHLCSTTLEPIHLTGFVQTGASAGVAGANVSVAETTSSGAASVLSGSDGYYSLSIPAKVKTVPSIAVSIRSVNYLSNLVTLTNVVQGNAPQRDISLTSGVTSLETESSWSPTQISLNGGYLYYITDSTNGAPGLYRMTTSGGSLTNLAPGLRGSVLQIRGTAAYTGRVTGSISKVLLDGSSTSVFASDSGAFMGSNADYLFLTSPIDPTIQRVSLSNGAVITLADYTDPDFSTGSGITADADYVYYIRRALSEWHWGAAPSSLVKMPVNGGTEQTLLSTVTFAESALAIDDTYVYFILSTSMGSYIEKVRKDGTSAAVRLGNQSIPGCGEYNCWIGLDADNVYVAAVNSVYRVPKTNGRLIQLATSCGDFSGIAVDSNYLFASIVNCNSPKVIKIDKISNANSFDPELVIPDPAIPAPGANAAKIVGYLVDDLNGYRPMPGVTIAVTATATSSAASTTTDANGNFVLTVPMSGAFATVTYTSSGAGSTPATRTVAIVRGMISSEQGVFTNYYYS